MIREYVINSVRMTCWIGDNHFDAGKRRIVFIHGAGGDHTIWKEQYQVLQSEFNIIVINLPGHGLSGGFGEMEVTRYAKWVKDLIEGIGFKEKPVLIGHSLGAAICLTFAIHYGARLSGIVSVGGGVKLPVNQMIMEKVKTDIDSVISLLLKFAIAKANRDIVGPVICEGIKKTNPAVLYGDMHACNNFDISDSLRNINVPVLVICGDEDKMTPPILSKYLADNIEGAKLQLVQGAGHFVMIEDSKAFNKILSDFLRSLPN